MHLTTPDAVRAFLAGRSAEEWATTALIFHCEFSTERGPRAAKHVRNEVRRKPLSSGLGTCASARLLPQGPAGAAAELLPFLPPTPLRTRRTAWRTCMTTPPSRTRTSLFCR